MRSREPQVRWRRPGLALASGLLAAACSHGDAVPPAPAPAAPAAATDSPLPERELRWPVQGRILSRFGHRRSTHAHQGLDIGVPRGTPVRAAAAGRVVFSGRMKGYGNVVILDHGRGIETVYAHNRANRVRRGERVERGEIIADSGASGNATAPHLHFEVREAQRPRDPLGYLPRAHPASSR